MVPVNGRPVTASAAAVALLLALAAAFAPGPAGASAATVSAGALKAQVGARSSRWQIGFTDARGRPVLTEHRGRGRGPTGSLGFETESGWRHATKIIRQRRGGAAVAAVLATNDPGGRRLRVRVARDRPGVIALRASVVGERAGVTSLGIGFRADRRERYLGFGERSNGVDQRGGVVENYVGEGPYQADERPLIAAFVPEWGFQQRDDATYFPVPWLLSTDGYGVLVDNAETSYFRLGTDRPGAWSVEVTNAPPEQPQGAAAPAPKRISLRVFAGPEPADALRRFTAATGRQPRAAAPWYFGPWFQASGDSAARISALRAADAPVSVGQTYRHYLPCGDHVGRREEDRERTELYHSQGLAVTTYFNPMLCTTYDRVYDAAAAAGVLTRDGAGEPYVYRYSTNSRFLVSQFDFSSPAGPGFFSGLLAEAVEDGYDGWMEDFGEYTPLDSRSANGMGGTRMHNAYPVQYHCAAQEFADSAARPLGRFARSGFTGVAPCAPIVWGGDPTVGWGFDGLESAVANGLTMGLSGISTWGSDIGGFFAIGDEQLTPELLKRWVQFGAVSGVMRTQANGIAIPSKTRPQIWDPAQIANWRRYAKLRTQLYPYLAAADREYSRSGMPIMRQLSLAYPRDRRAAAAEHEYMFGPDLLAAPVIEAGATTRRLYLPGGPWIDLWRSVRYVPATGALALGSIRTIRGGGGITLPAPLRELPLLARAGALLPMLPADVDTLAGYGSGPGLVDLGDRADRIELLAFPHGTSAARFYGGGRVESRERRRGWVLQVKSGQPRSYRLQASMGSLERRFRPCEVALDGESLPRSAWGYEPAVRSLTARFRVERGRLRVTPCGRR